MSAQLYSETVTGASSAFKQDTRSGENVVQLHESQKSYTNMLLVSPVKEQDLPAQLLRFPFPAVPVKKRQPARRELDFIATGRERNVTG